MRAAARSSPGGAWQRAAWATLVAVLASLVAGPASAWSNHALCTWTALSVLPEVAGRPPVRVTSLASFVAPTPPASRSCCAPRRPGRGPTCPPTRPGRRR